MHYDKMRTIHKTETRIFVDLVAVKSYYNHKNIVFMRKNTVDAHIAPEPNRDCNGETVISI